MKPYYEHRGITIYHGDCKKILRTVKDKWYDFAFADPPYGIDKAPWDQEYPAGFESEILRVARTVAITPGMWALPKCLDQVRNKYIGIIAGRNVNGMTFSPLGFGNWIPTVICGDKPAQGPDVLEFVVAGNPPDHPSPKPFRYMLQLLKRLTVEDDLILDPFAGVGTTLEAAQKLGRRAVGIEIEEKYCEIAAKRLNQEIFQWGNLELEQTAN